MFITQDLITVAAAHFLSFGPEEALRYSQGRRELIFGGEGLREQGCVDCSSAHRKCVRT